MNIDIYNTESTTPLYASPNQSQQGFQADVSAQKLPVELSKAHIKHELIKIGNEHVEHEKFINNCSRFAKFLFEKQSRDFNQEPYQRLDSKILKQKLGKNPDRAPLYYFYIIESLRSIGLVEVNENYEFTKDGTGKCKGYRIHLKFPEKYEVSTTQDLFPQRNKGIDDQGYLHELKRLKMNEIMFVFIANFLPHDEKQRAFYIYHNWISGNHFVTKDNYGRIHSLLTLMDKRLRCCFTIDDVKQIGEWDIHACMPFLYLKIIEEHVNFRKANKLTLAELSESNQEIGTYVNWIKNGRFYAELYRAFHKLKGEPKSSERINALKTSFFKNILFSDTPIKDKERNIHKVFAALFPTINQSLIKFKRKEGYKAVAQTLQSLESELMNLAIQRLKKKNPSNFYLRYHDAILTDDLDRTQVEAVMTQTIMELYGIQGKVKYTQTWGVPFETVARSLRLHVYSTFLSHKGKKFNAKLKAAYIKKKVAGVSKESRHYAVEQASKNYDQNEDNQLKNNKNINDFMTPTLYLPSHWDANMVIEFKAYALATINEVFAEAESQHSAGSLKLIQKNKELVVKLISGEP